MINVLTIVSRISAVFVNRICFLFYQGQIVLFAEVPVHILLVALCSIRVNMKNQLKLRRFFQLFLANVVEVRGLECILDRYPEVGVQLEHLMEQLQKLGVVVAKVLEEGRSCAVYLAGHVSEVLL